MPEIRSVPTECVTMGHSKCLKHQQKQSNGYWKTYLIMHNVYGRQHIERIKD